MATTPHPSTLWETQELDLEAYMDRIGHDGPREPTLETLRTLQAAHLDAIPFEGLDSVLGRDVHIDLVSVQDKLIRRRRGGYCHEHNTLFATVLDRLGFRVTGRAARILMGADEHRIGPVSHSILSVEVDGVDHHVDVGVGNTGPRGPIPLVEGDQTATGPWVYRMERTDLGTGCCGCVAQTTGSTSFSSPRSPTTGPTTPSTTSSPPRTPRHRLCDGSWWNTTGATCAGHWPT